MRRRIFTLAAAGSLALFVGTIALWVRSYWVEDEISRGGWDAALGWRQRNFGIYSAFGRIRPWYKTDDPWGANLKADGVHLAWAWISGPANPSGNWFGPPPVTLFNIRYWQIAVITLAVPFLWWRRYRQWRALNDAGLCPTCNYNLTGNTSGTCPECGTPVPINSIS